MNIRIVPLAAETLSAAVEIWNEVVRAGNAFPQQETLTLTSGRDFFAAQTFVGVAVETATSEVMGLYILHPNNVGRCGHICNASYAVKADCRGRGIGESLVKSCIQMAKQKGFRVLQFNAVVKSNHSALKLYQKLGFVQLGCIPGGFLNRRGEYEDIIPHYLELV